MHYEASRQVETICDQQTAEQGEAARRAVARERQRIAHELHDVVAHSITVMVLHAAGAKRVVESDTARAKTSMTIIEESGRQAIGELRRLLKLLRQDDVESSAADTSADSSPLPGLAHLDDVMAVMRSSGVDIDLAVTGEPQRLDTGIDLAAFRLVQEALTNVTKHARGGTAATVSFDWSAERLTVAVQNTGGQGRKAITNLSTGHGLAGLDERISVIGGEFMAGPTNDGGFRVAANLPVVQSPGRRCTTSAAE